MNRLKLEKIAAIAKNETVFLCGSTANENEMLDQFQKVFYLKIDEPTMIKRLKERTNHDYGKAPDELMNELQRRKGNEEKFERLGATMLDATMPLNELCDIIIQASK